MCIICKDPEVHFLQVIATLIFTKHCNPITQEMCICRVGNFAFCLLELGFLMQPGIGVKDFRNRVILMPTHSCL